MQCKASCLSGEATLTEMALKPALRSFPTWQKGTPSSIKERSSQCAGIAKGTFQKGEQGTESTVPAPPSWLWAFMSPSLEIRSRDPLGPCSCSAFWVCEVEFHMEKGRFHPHRCSFGSALEAKGRGFFFVFLGWGIVAHTSSQDKDPVETENLKMQKREWLLREARWEGAGRPRS